MGLKRHVTRDQRVLGLPGVPGMAENNSALRGLARFDIKDQPHQSQGAENSVTGEVIVSRAALYRGHRARQGSAETEIEDSGKSSGKATSRAGEGHGQKEASG